MADLRRKLDAEFDNIERAIALVPETTAGLSPLELAGVGDAYASVRKDVEPRLTRRT